jgi:hypothetical protein
MHGKRSTLVPSSLGALVPVPRRLPFFLTLGAAALALGLTPWLASPGEYHVGQTLVCMDCHAAHYSQQHQYDGAPGPGAPALTGGPNAALLRQADITDLCLGCHDGQTFAPDVAGANASNYVRQAGALNRVGGAAPYEDWRGHTLDMEAVAPGGSSNLTLTCRSCHTVHGSSDAYRNLNGCPSSSACIRYSKDGVYASRDLTRDAWLRQWVRGDLAGNYAYDSVRFNEPNPGGSRYARFCAGCHGSFHGTVGDIDTIGGDLMVGQFLRHPSAQVNIGSLASDGEHSSIMQYNGGRSRVHVMSAAATDYFANPGSGAFTPASGLSPSCFSCHKAHGNQNPFALIFLDRTSITVTEEGTAGTTAAVGLRYLCSQCHVQTN